MCLTVVVSRGSLQIKPRREQGAINTAICLKIVKGVCCNPLKPEIIYSEGKNIQFLITSHKEKHQIITFLKL